MLYTQYAWEFIEWGAERKQTKKTKANKYPFPSLLLQERPDHGVQGMDVPWLVNKMNSSKSCWETILEQHGGGKKSKHTLKHWEGEGKVKGTNLLFHTLKWDYLYSKGEKEKRTLLQLTL